MAAGDIFADIIGADGQFPVAAVDQNDQLDGLRASEVDDTIHRGADAASGIEHIVHQDDGFADDAERHFRAGYFRRGIVIRNIVTVGHDVQRPDGDR